MRAGKQVLVVDDDEYIRELVQMALADEGYDVITAGHGQEALRVAEAQRPMVILLDMQMPVMDGWEFARVYRELPVPHAPIVVMTAAREATERCSQIDADRCLSKPFDLDELYRIVRECVPAA